MRRIDPATAALVTFVLAILAMAFVLNPSTDVPAPQTVPTPSPACSTRDTQAALLIPMLTRYDRLEQQALTAALTGHRRRALDLAAHTGPVTTTRWVEAEKECER